MAVTNQHKGLLFSKLEALGNDFILVDSRDENRSLETDWIRQLSDRRIGVGFDQLLLLKQTGQEENDALFTVEIFNADGSRAEQCGNGLRAIALWLDQRDQLREGITISTLAGLSTLRPGIDGKYSASLPGLCILSNALLPQLPRTVVCAELISLGNPHLVLHWPHNPSEPELIEVADRIQSQTGWNNRCNIGLAYLDSAKPGSTVPVIHLRVHERGTGTTRACGSGACAAAVSMIRQNDIGPMLCVQQPGGTVMVNWSPNQDHVTLTGPARTIFEGRLA